MSDNLARIIPGDSYSRTITATVFVAFVLAISLIIFKKYNKKFLVRSKQLYLYLIPLILAVILPLHYHLTSPWYMYVFMIVVTVFWQDYLTFGIFQTYIQSKVKTLLAVILVGSLFTLGHFIFFVSSFSPESIPLWIALLCTGILFAWLRKRFGNIYTINVLHMSFLLLLV